MKLNGNMINPESKIIWSIKMRHTFPNLLIMRKSRLHNAFKVLSTRRLKVGSLELI